MEVENLISVIVPVYNVKDYLDRCVNSIVKQTYKRLEIILVDDGSNDGSSNICDSWVEKDKRIRVVHKTNGGLSDARNVGIDESKGEYLLFVDSDDYIDSLMCEKMVTLMENTQSDIAVCNFFWEYHAYSKEHIGHKNGVVSKNRVLEEFFQSDLIGMVVAWNKLYKRKLFFTEEHIRYPVGRLHEDEFVTYRLLYAAQNVAFTKEPLYFYVQRSESIMANYSERNLNDFSIAVQGYLKWVNKFAPEKRKFMEYLTVYNVLAIYMRCAEYPQLSNGREICDKMKKYVDSAVDNYWYNPLCNNVDRMKFILFKIGIYGNICILWQCLKKLVKLHG